MSRIAEVLLPIAVPEAFDYAEPEGMDLVPGSLVHVPLGPRTVLGVVASLRDGGGGNRPLKPVLEALTEPPLPPATLAFVQWAARYSIDVPGAALAMTLRGLRAPRPRPERRLVVTGQVPARLTATRQSVMDAAADPISGPDLARKAGVSSGVIKALVDEGVLRQILTDPDPGFGAPDLDLIGAALNPSQAAAAKALIDLVQTGGFGAVLLDGVTGSGKTEVYLEAAAAALAKDPDAQVLVLLPEIALTQAVLTRFEQRFGARPAEWHSGIAPPRRRQIWEAVVSGQCRIVVGARSALFLPFSDLRLIVVDEEHDGSYKQDEGFIYQARDLAVVRAKMEKALVVLASATPSLETVWNAETGRYGWLKLSARHGEAVLPDIDLIDLRATPLEAGRWLSPPLVQAMAQTYARGEQSLLFLNRRGYAPLVLCKACGERMCAPDTESWLVEHRYTGRLICHLTGFSMPKPKACPHCFAIDSLVSIGPGVERIEEEVRERFPEARIEVFSSDTVRDAASARALCTRKQHPTRLRRRQRRRRRRRRRARRRSSWQRRRQWRRLRVLRAGFVRTRRVLCVKFKHRDREFCRAAPLPGRAPPNGGDDAEARNARETGSAYGCGLRLPPRLRGQDGLVTGWRRASCRSHRGHCKKTRRTAGRRPPCRRPRRASCCATRRRGTRRRRPTCTCRDR